MKTRFTRISSLVAIVSSAIALSMCSQEPMSAPTSPSVAAPSSSNLVGDLTDATPVIAKLKICKTGNVGSGTFTVSSTGTNTTVASPYVITNNECRIVVESSDEIGGNVTVTETSSSFQGATSLSIGGVSAPFTNGSSLFINTIHGYTITFTNFEAPPPVGGQGCTPGYWKQPHHFDSWPAPYAPGQDFDTTFGVNFFTPDITLVEAAGLGGGDVNALARQAVAGLLSAASTGVAYQYTVAQVLDIVQGDGAYAGLSVEARKNLLAAANESGCPLN